MSTTLLATRDASPTPTASPESSEAANTSNTSNRTSLQQQQQQETCRSTKKLSATDHANSKNSSQLDQTNHQPQQNHYTHSTTATDATNTSKTRHPARTASPLPIEAKRILTEVAQTGCYTLLPWTAPRSSPRKRPRTEQRYSSHETHHQQQADTSSTATGIHENSIQQQQHLQSATTHSTPTYTSLQQVLQMSVRAVLEYYYTSHGGYKLAPAEYCRHKTTTPTSTHANATRFKEHQQPTETSLLQLEEQTFQQRLQRLLTALETPSSTDGEPPFTVQRIAEVLVAPERYYTQTHKLCNCLEKLVLVTSSARAFGGMNGGDASQAHRAAQEMAALAEENDRFQSHYLHRLQQQQQDQQIQPLSTSPSRHSPDDYRHDSSLDYSSSDSFPSSSDSVYRPSPESAAKDSVRDLYLESAARSSLRTKFDHGGLLDQGNHKRDVVRIMTELRGLTNSPPLPSASHLLNNCHGSLLRTHHDVELGRTSSPSSPPSSLLFPDGVHHPTLSLLHATGAVSGLTPLELAAAAAIDNKDVDLESRSSASSDVDSESDDISLDDSASDRSDGSSDHEPLTRAMIWRQQQQQQQQQQRLSQSQRLQRWSSLQQPQPQQLTAGNVDGGGEVDVMSHHSHGEFRTDDSVGSDSSMSDMTD